MMKFSCKFDKFYGYVVNTIMVLVTGALLLLALFSTSVITAGEYTTYASDNVFLQIIAVAVVMVIAVCAVKSEKIKKMLENPMLPRIAFIALASFLLVLIVGTQLSPGSDSGMICAVARRIISNDLSEDFTLTTIQYMQKYPNQNGMVVFIYLLFNLVGVDNYVALQIINLISLGVAYYFIYVLLRELFGIRIANVSLLIMCAFLPFSIYVMFVYGTMLGMAFAMMACTFLVKFFKTGKMRYGFIAAVSAALATAFKSNYMIVFVALVITALLVFLRSKDFKVLAVVALVCILNLLVSPVTSALYSKISGAEPSNGIPHLAWVAMGLQESKGKAEGWYNGYNDMVFENNGRDTALANEECKAYLSERIPYMLKNPAYTLKFFAKKTASQWNNPTFECFTFIQDMQINHHKVMPALQALYDNDSGVNKMLAFWMNIMQSCILVGAFLYFVINFKKNDVLTLLYAVIFVGGFLFHFIWEAKCQYTVVYVLLLIPYAVMGYNAVCKKIAERKK
ncbi:MAG: glycosyltransferase family 39 protein [Clostridia bacterium]|nr:glycosyltransferase family 39 protein [Clostridia bacterium]